MSYGKQRKPGRYALRSKKPTYKKRASARQWAARQSLSLIELGTFQTAETQEVTDVNAEYLTLHLPTRSATNFNNRIGDKTIIKEIKVNFTVIPNSAANVTVNADVRVMLVWDKQPNAGLPASPLPLSAGTPYEQLSPSYQDRFRILRSGIFTTGFVNPGTNTFSRSAPVVWHVKGLNLVSKFIGNGGTITDLETGHLFLFMLGNVAIGSNESPIVKFSAETKYVM